MHQKDIMELIQPNDFSALFQLAFTLYTAFLAIEYAKSFTALVIRRFYNFQGEIESSINDIIKQCRDNELQNIESDDYFKFGDGLCLVVDFKKKHQECLKKASEIKNTTFGTISVVPLSSSHIVTGIK